MQAPSKTCPYCKESKPADTEHFVIIKGDRLGPSCKTCAKAWREAMARKKSIRRLKEGM